MPITVATLHAICRVTALDHLERFVGPLNAAFEEFGIDTEKRQAHFLAQVAHESAAFRATRELWGPTGQQARYDARDDLGNTDPEAVAIAAKHGDKPGHFYRGRGLIQTTGYTNYCQVRDALNIDCVEHPELLEQPEAAARSAAFFWQKHGLNEYADRNDVKGITKKINGGYNGLPERVGFWQAAQAVLA